MRRRENYYFFTYSPSLEKDFQHGVSIQVGGCLCVHMCMFFFFFYRRGHMGGSAARAEWLSVRWGATATPLAH